MTQTFTPSHYGLFFGRDQVEQARKHAKRQPFSGAWARLHDYDTTASGPEPLMIRALRWRFDDDHEAGAEAVPVLSDMLESGPETPENGVMLAQCVELLRDHPAAQNVVGMWSDSLASSGAGLSSGGADDTVMTRLWHGLALFCYGIVREDEGQINAGAAVYRSVIDADIHPEGYLTEAVETSAEEGLRNQVRCVQALVMMAEAGRQVGIDLWGYDNRGVSAVTAASYPLYFYFYAEKWPWGEKTWKRGEGLLEETLELEAAQRVFRERAGWLELLNYRYGPRPLKAVRLVLDELRPVFDVRGGGLTSLTHGVPEGRRGLFG